MKTVMASGSFDLIHPGHLYYLGEAKKYGDKLVVVVARDSSILRFKGKRPKYSERERLERVRQLSIVDEAILGNEGNIFDIISEIKPDAICLGYDQKPTTMEELKEELKKRNIKAEVIRVGAYRPEIYKSSKMK
ncbi:adenylyltransferase/cytidyltransferase family protein [Candidatus Woesearchaeota archaeon]|nr:adenylyltransferase/cytidyltransferase family protein [Candidatus Woesearchaeota archaeon]